MKLKTLEFVGKKLRPVELALFVKWILRIKRMNLKIDDKRVHYIDPISDLGLKLLKNGEYETDMSNAIANILQKGDNFIDLGSNEGYFSIFASNICGSGGQVIAIEPQERLWNIILKNVAINNLTNITLLPFAIGDKKEKLTLNLYPVLNTGASSFSSKFNFKVSFQKFRKKLYGKQIAHIVPLDQLIPILPNNIKLMKIDIEGFELNGAKKILKDKIIDNLLVEIHEEAMREMQQSESQIDDLLLSMGYNKKSICENLNLYTAT